MQQLRSFIICCLALFLATIAPQCLYAWTGKVVGIADGDTITVLNDQQQVKIRLHGIDTPEKTQAFGKAAKKATANLTAGKIVEVEQTDTDKYGRTVAIVTAGSVNVNQALVKSGYAWIYHKYCKQDFCNDWLKLEEQAKNARLGLWKDKDPEPPWEWRKTSKADAGSPNSVGGNFHGNVSSKVFHAAGCKHFNCKGCTVSFVTAEEARMAGYRPDKWCVR